LILAKDNCLRDEASGRLAKPRLSARQMSDPSADTKMTAPHRNKPRNQTFILEDTINDESVEVGHFIHRDSHPEV
jgi:hypothetical protein